MKGEAILPASLNCRRCWICCSPLFLCPPQRGGFTALNPETGTTSQGDSVEEAIANLREATELYLEEFPLVVSGQPLVTTFDIEVHG